MNKTTEGLEKAIRFNVPVELLETHYEGNRKFYQVTIPVSEAPDFIRELLATHASEERKALAKWVKTLKLELKIHEPRCQTTHSKMADYYCNCGEGSGVGLIGFFNINAKDHNNKVDQVLSMLDKV